MQINTVNTQISEIAIFLYIIVTTFQLTDLWVKRNKYTTHTNSKLTTAWDILHVYVKQSCGRILDVSWKYCLLTSPLYNFHGQRTLPQATLMQPHWRVWQIITCQYKFATLNYPMAYTHAFTYKYLLLLCYRCYYCTIVIS